MSEAVQVIRYQRARMPRLRLHGSFYNVRIYSHALTTAEVMMSFCSVDSRETDCANFDYNLHEYFASAFGSNPIPMRTETSAIVVKQRDFDGDRQQFAREVVMFGRKNGTLLEEAISQ